MWFKQRFIMFKQDVNGVILNAKAQKKFERPDFSFFD